MSLTRRAIICALMMGCLGTSFAAPPSASTRKSPSKTGDELSTSTRDASKLMKERYGKAKLSEESIGLLESYFERDLWLRVDLAQLDFSLGEMDTTRLYPDGRLQYEAYAIGSGSIQSSDAKEFKEEVLRQNEARKDDSIFLHVNAVRITDRGSVVRLVRLKSDKNEVFLLLRDINDNRAGITFMLNVNSYTTSELKTCLESVFALEAESVSREVTQGMAESEVVDKLGAPDSRITLDDKTILVYPNLKCVLRNGKLESVE